MRRPRLKSAFQGKVSAFSTPEGRLHLGVIAFCLVALVATVNMEDSFLPACLGTVLAFECAIVSDRRGGPDAAVALLSLRAESFTVGAARLLARVAALCAAACVVTFLLPLVVLVVSPPQRDVLFLFPVLVVAIMTARVMYVPAARWRARLRPAARQFGPAVALAARVYEESCRILIPANARPAQLEARARPLPLLFLLLRAAFAFAAAALAVVLSLAFFAMPALLPNSVFEEDLSAVTAQGQIVFPTMAIVGVFLVDGLQWARGRETTHELAATVHVIAVAVAVAVLGGNFDEIISWAGSLSRGLTGPSETAASVAVGTAFGVVGALFLDAAQALLCAVVFLTRPHRGLPRRSHPDDCRRRPVSDML